MRYFRQRNLLGSSTECSVCVSKDFKEYMEHVSISEDDYHNIEFLLNFFRGPQDPLVTSRSFVFYGRPGVGKTFFAERIIHELNKETLYNACKTLNFSKSVRCESIKEIFEHLNSSKEQVIFLDDLKYLFSSTEYGEYETEDKRDLMELLELVKQHHNKILIMTMNGLGSLDNQLIDRMEVIIRVDIPDQVQKKQFLQNHYMKYLSNDVQSFIADNTIGYNYRDLPEMLKLAYRIGNHQLTKDSVKKALTRYRPTQLYGFHVENGVSETLDDVIGKKKQLRVLKRIVAQYRYQDVVERLQLKRSNILLFHGPPGTGKSFMTRALAGEVQFPLIHVGTSHFHGGNPFRGLHQIVDMGKRYQRCVIFVDEAEKMLGNGRYGEDNPVLGELHRLMDGGDGGDIQSILVFAINDLSRFGNTLLDRFNLVEFSLPDFGERMEFFSKKMSRVHDDVSVSFSVRDLAFRSEEMSFREMDRFWNDLMYAQLEGVEEKESDKGLFFGVRQKRCYGDMMFG